MMTAGGKGNNRLPDGWPAGEPARCANSRWGVASGGGTVDGGGSDTLDGLWSALSYPLISSQAARIICGKDCDRRQ